MSKEEGEMTGRKRSLRAMGARRSARLTAAGTSEEDKILNLKREIDDLINRRVEEGQRMDALFGIEPVEEALPAAAAAGEERKKKKVKVLKKEVPQRIIDYFILNPHDPLL